MTEIDEETEITISSKMPAWMRTCLAEAGFDHTFKLAELTNEQKFELNLAKTMLDLEEKGLITVDYDPKTMPAPEFRLTQKGRKVARKLVKIR